MYKIGLSSMTVLVGLHIMLSDNVKETAVIMIENHILIAFSRKICGKAFIMCGTLPCLVKKSVVLYSFILDS